MRSIVVKMRWTYQYWMNKNVFTDCLKVSVVHSGSQRSSGGEFQTVGLTTENAR